LPEEDQQMAEKKPSGLEDVVVCESRICFIDGQRGQLVYRGYDIDDLALHSTFEEVAFLLWNNRLPLQAELDDLRAQLIAAMTLPAELIEMLRALPCDADAMRILQVGVSALGILDPEGDDTSPDALRVKAIKLAAQLPTLTTTWHRLREGHEVLPPNPDYGVAWNFLYLMSGQEPEHLAARTFDAALILHADHELNASTFSARVTAATLSDMYSAVVSAIGTLKGPLHGGANEAVMSMLREIPSADAAAQYVEDAVAQKKKIMGFGHRVYKAKDPRAKILEEMSRALGEKVGDTSWFDKSVAVEAAFQPRVAAKGIYPNVDFFSASAYHVMGIPDDLFTPIFACSRVVGWTSHLLEQYANNRLFRPDSDYVGEKGLKWKPAEERTA
jgi:citrate synthase